MIMIMIMIWIIMIFTYISTSSLVNSNHMNPLERIGDIGSFTHLLHQTSNLPSSIRQILGEERGLEEELDQNHASASYDVHFLPLHSISLSLSSQLNIQSPGRILVESIGNVHRRQSSIAEVVTHKKNGEDVIANKGVESENDSETNLQSEEGIPLRMQSLLGLFGIAWFIHHLRRFSNHLWIIIIDLKINAIIITSVLV